MPRHTISLVPALGVVFASATTHAEPIVVRLDPGVNTAEFTHLHPDLPDIILDEWVVFGGGLIEVFPRLYPSTYLIEFCGPPPFAVEQATGTNGGAPRFDAIPAGVEVGAALSGWACAFFCFDFDFEWPAMLSGFTDFGCSLTGCPDDIALGFGTPTGTAVVPIRTSNGTESWNYAWIAFDFKLVVTPECSFCVAQPPGDLVTGDWSVIGFGYETSPDTPIVNGGGLCAADYDSNAVLDPADITAFVGFILTTDPLADFDDNGLFDLFDIVGFIEAFTTGCGL